MGADGTVTYLPLELVRRMARGRAVFTSRLGRVRYHYLIGPEANALVFAHDDWFSFAEAMKVLVPVDGPTSVLVSDGEEHARRRGLIRPSMAPRSIEHHLQAVARSAREATHYLRGGATVDVYPLFRRAIRRATLRVLFDDDLARDADELGALLQPLLDYVAGVQLVELRARWRTPLWRRAMAAREVLDSYVYERVDEVAATPPAAAGDSVLSLLVHGRDGNGSGLTREEVRDQTVTLIAAGYETTSAAMGWAAHVLARHPYWQQRASDEAASLASGEVTAADISALTVLPAIVNETLRLYPPAAISARHVERPFSFAGTPVKAGELVLYSPYLTHRDPRVFERPTDFDPARWIDAPRPAPDTFVPFGGGGHRCLGSHLAVTELVIMVAHLVAAGPFAAVGRTPGARSIAALRPTHARVRFAADRSGAPRPARV